MKDNSKQKDTSSYTSGGTEGNSATVTPRDYTIIELRKKSKQQARRMFWIGMLMGIALFILLAFFLGIRIG